MNGFLNHLKITLRLTFRNKQAVVFSYIFPLAFLFMFAIAFRSQPNRMGGVMGQLLTMTALGAAIFGLPISLVIERERGIWRRYRLVPIATGWFVASTMIARFAIIVTSAVFQVFMAVKVLPMMGLLALPMPLHPFELTLTFTLTCFAFMGLGLLIATLADTTSSVQAMAQCLFLPMMVLGGVGLPLYLMPPFAEHIAAFLPGRYAVEAMQACVTQVNGLGAMKAFPFHLAALLIIGGAACFVVSRLFRWETQQKLTSNQRWWALAALLPWIAVGLAAEALELVGTK